MLARVFNSSSFKLFQGIGNVNGVLKKTHS